jgi:hypothetical protein
LRIKIVQLPTIACIDGVQLDRFLLGFQYDVGTTLATYLLAERWAEPVVADDPTLMSELEPDVDPEFPSNLQRETHAPYYEGPPDFAPDRRRRSLRHKR